MAAERRVQERLARERREAEERGANLMAQVTRRMTPERREQYMFDFREVSEAREELYAFALRHLIKALANKPDDGSRALVTFIETVLRRGARLPERLHRVPDGERLVYFARSADGGPIKIGSSTNPAVRVGELSCGASRPIELLATTRGGRREEHALHMRFGHLRVHREWFAPAPELIAYIEGLQ